MGRIKREPSADLRELASNAHEMFTAYKDAGFTDEQALDLVKSFQSTSLMMMNIGDNDDDD